MSLYEHKLLQSDTEAGDAGGTSWNPAASFSSIQRVQHFTEEIHKCLQKNLSFY